MLIGLTVITWHYDEYGRTTNKVDAASNLVLTYTYDPNSRLTNHNSLAKGNTVYRYDPVSNVTNIDYNTSPDITLMCDALNRLTNMVDALGTTVYSHNAIGQLLRRPVEQRYRELHVRQCPAPKRIDTVSTVCHSVDAELRLRKEERGLGNGSSLACAHPCESWHGNFAWSSPARFPR